VILSHVVVGRRTGLPGATESQNARFRRLALEGAWWKAAYEVGECLDLFNPKTAAWDRLDLRTIAGDKQEPRATKGR
jgi:hypothetical protein